jgi:hypothetical protein
MASFRCPNGKSENGYCLKKAATELTGVISGPTVTNSSQVKLTVLFSKEVSKLQASQFEVSNGKALSVSGSGKNYELFVQPTAQGLVTVELVKGQGGKFLKIICIVGSRVRGSAIPGDHQG